MDNIIQGKPKSGQQEVSNSLDAIKSLYNVKYQGAAKGQWLADIEYLLELIDKLRDLVSEKDDVLLATLKKEYGLDNAAPKIIIPANFGNYNLKNVVKGKA